jgi:hypothetical protein
MGIYSSGRIFGIRIYQFNEDDVSNVLFEETYHEEMTHAQWMETYLFYIGLANTHGTHVQYYTECSSTHDKQNTRGYMMWHPVSIDRFLEKINGITM